MFYGKKLQYNPEKPYQDYASPNREGMEKPNAGTVLTDSALRNKIISSCNNIPACDVTILQQTFTVAKLINNIYTAIENSEETIKAEKAKSLELSITYFTDRKYYINRSSPSSNNSRFTSSNNNRFTPSNNSSFQRKHYFICEKPGC